MKDLTNFNNFTVTKDFEITVLSQEAPLAPVMKSNSFTSITLEPIEGGEYRCTKVVGETETEVATWQKSNVFTDLTAGTEYTFYQRKAADASHNESESSEGTKISTKKHAHDWTYKASGATITATCLNGDGGHEGEVTAIVIIEAENKVYTGEAVEATLTGSIDGVENPTIVYKKGDEVLDEAPKAVGEYTASITIGTATASVDFEITRAAGGTVNPENMPTKKTDLVYSGSALALVASANTALLGYTVVYAVSDTEPTDEKEYSAIIPTRILPGTYKVWYMFKGDGNHNDITDVYSLTDITIDKKELTVTAKPKTITYGDEPSANGVTYDGFVEGQDEKVLTGTLDYEYTYAQYGNVGNTYTITPK